MHAQHDLDLIAAFVEGTLEDPARAEALIESCRECAGQAQAHRTVLAAFAADDVVPMTELERRRLHAAVWDSFNPEPVGRQDAVPTRSTPTTPWWYRMVPVAAALVIVVGVVANLAGDDGKDESFTTAAAQMQPEADAFSPRGSDQEEADQAGAGEMYSATTMAGSTDTTAAADLRVYDSRNLAAAAADFADRAFSESAVDEDALVCVGEADASRVVAAEQSYVDGESAWFIGFDDTDGVTVEVYLASGCEMIFPAE